MGQAWPISGKGGDGAQPSPATPSANDLQLQDFFENGGIALHLVDGDGLILEANRAELELLGYERDDYVGQPIAGFHADQHVIDDILARLSRGETLQKYPARLRARDGSIKHVEITSSARFEDARFVNTRCFTVDVTDLVQTKAELKRKDNVFHQVLDALPAAVYMTDAHGKITYYNKAAADLAGREPEIGKDEWCVTFRLFGLDGKELPHDQCPMAIALKENRPVRGVEAMAQRPDGTLFPFLPFPTPITDEDGKLTGAVNMLVDVSERKQAESNQRILLDELNHRVKNNLQMLQALLWAAVREAENAEASRVLADAARRVGAMAAAQQLLYSDRNPRSFNITEFLHAVCAGAQQAFGKEISMQIEADQGQLPNELSMPLALVLNELVTNAAKHGINGRGTGNINVKFRRENGYALLSVEDDGPGFQLEETGRRSSGLGLVQGMMRQLGGEFTVEPGSGGRCIIRFPAAGISGPMT